MSAIFEVHNPWRDLLVKTQASFKDVMFHVESGGRSSGLRSVVHEYPKRNEPYAESMGRHARRFQFSGYLVYRPRRTNETNPLRYDYVKQRIKLFEALESDDFGKLVHPVFAPTPGIDVMCERYTMTESRERGGYTQFEMAFVEYGKPVSAMGLATPNTRAAVNTTAQTAESTAVGLQRDMLASGAHV